MIKLNHKSWSLRQRLLLTIGAILIFCQLVSAFWLWHESKEQIQILVESALHSRDYHKSIEHELRESVASLLIPSMLIVGLALALCYQAVNLITRPLAKLQQELESRSPDNLFPVELDSRISEVDAVTQAINQLVERLTLTLDRERLFTTDVAHELRTPLAGLRLHLELLSRSKGIDVDPLLQRLDQMTDNVVQLLQLARVGQSFSAGSYQHVWLIKDVIMPLREELETMLAARQQRLVLPDSAQDIQVRGDVTLLRVILRNLTENAHRYSPENTAITLSVDGSGTVLAVEDEGPGIDESQNGELSKAFVRMDSRYGGIGLGLSIVSRIVQLHDGQFFLHNRSPLPGVRAWVKLLPVTGER